VKRHAIGLHAVHHVPAVVSPAQMFHTSKRSASCRRRHCYTVMPVTRQPRAIKIFGFERDRTKSGVRAAAGTGSVLAGTAAGIGKGLCGRRMIVGGSMGPPVA
jgi:hypothetical protein